MSDTPRTDAFVVTYDTEANDALDFARQLERELAAAQRELSMVNELYDKEVLAHGETETRAEKAEAELAACRDDAERYAMLFCNTWIDGSGVGVFRYTYDGIDGERLGFEQVNEHFVRVKDKARKEKP